MLNVVILFEAKFAIKLCILITDLCYLIFPTRKVWTMYGAKNFCELAVCVGLFINLKSHTSILTDSLAMISARLQLSHTTPPQKMFGFFFKPN